MLAERGTHFQGPLRAFLIVINSSSCSNILLSFQIVGRFDFFKFIDIIMQNDLQFGTEGVRHFKDEKGS